MARQCRNRHYSSPSALAFFALFVLGAGTTAAPQANQNEPNSESTMDVNTPSGGDAGQAVRITIIEDQDDPKVWAIVRSFQDDPSTEKAGKAFQILDEVLADWSSHPPGVVTTILNAIAEYRLESGRKYLVRFARTDPERPYSDHIVGAAAFALGDMGGARAFEELAALAQHRSSGVVSTVAFALGKFEDPRATTLLESLAQRPEAVVRGSSLSALGNHCVESSMPLAVENTKHADGMVRNSATWWLAQCGTPEQASLLTSLVGDSDRLVRGNALKGLLRLRSALACDRVPALIADRDLSDGLARDYEKFCKHR